jgi:hypothetical protein
VRRGVRGAYLRLRRVQAHAHPLAPLLTLCSACRSALPAVRTRRGGRWARGGSNASAWLWALALLPLALGRASASSVSNEVGGQLTQTTPSNPRAGDAADLLKANVDVADALILRAALGFTYEFATPTPVGGSFKGTDTSVFAVSLGLDWEVNDALTLSIDGVFSPSSTQAANTVITLTGPAGGTVDRNGLLGTVASSYGGDISADYAIGNPLSDRLALSLDADVGWLALTVDQTLERLENETGTEVSSIARIRTLCQTTQVPAQVHRCQALQPLLGSGADTLDEFRLAAGATLTIAGDTDVGLHAAYYLYNEDPSDFGYYSALTSGRTALHNVSLGNAVPLAPYLFTLRPDVTQRLGPFSVSLWYQFGIYASDLGTNQVVGARVGWAVSASWKLWLTGSIQVDLQPPFSTGSPLANGTQSTLSGAFAAGFRVRF